MGLSAPSHAGTREIPGGRTKCSETAKISQVGRWKSQYIYLMQNAVRIILISGLNLSLSRQMAQHAEKSLQNAGAGWTSWTFRRLTPMCDGDSGLFSSGRRKTRSRVQSAPEPSRRARL
jgi:hypothetical protein